MFDVILLIAKILFYSTCAAYIRSLYKDREYMPREEYHLLRNEYNRLVDYNKELKDKLLHQQHTSISDTVETTTLSGNSSGYASTTYYSKLPKEGWNRSTEPNPEYVPPPYANKSLEDNYLPKAKSIRLVSSLGDLYLTQDTGDVFVKVASTDNAYRSLIGKEMN